MQTKQFPVVQIPAVVVVVLHMDAREVVAPAEVALSSFHI
jgi:hypothetical protein